MKPIKTIQFTVPIIPVGEGRPRGRTFFPKWADVEQAIKAYPDVRDFMGWMTKHCHVMFYPDPKTSGVQEIIRRCYVNVAGVNAVPHPGPVKMACKFVMPIPQSWSKKKQEAALAGEIVPTSKPDYDNVLKLVSDALNKLAYEDDKQCFMGSWRMAYGPKPCIMVALWMMG